jgi:hypothetical protein
MAVQKKHFDIDTLSKSTVNAVVRQAQALEYIAHYLELIESHLAKLADVEPSLSQIGQSLVVLAKKKQTPISTSLSR